MRHRVILFVSWMNNCDGLVLVAYSLVVSFSFPGRGTAGTDKDTVSVSSAKGRKTRVVWGKVNFFLVLLLHIIMFRYC